MRKAKTRERLGSCRLPVSQYRHRIRFRSLHGLVLLDKPTELSSSQALQTVRRLFRAAKGGHAGALDPLATGLLPLCFGEATKLAHNLLGSRKAYLAECRLGVTTTTADREGEIIASRAVPALDDATVEALLVRFRGRIVQVPPVYSAIKQDGEPLYVKARRGDAVEAPPREVDIHRLECRERSVDTLTLYVECGSGTYIRSLATDLGEVLGCGAHLASLRRLWVEPFVQPQMVTLAQLQEAAGQGDAALQRWLLPMEAALAGVPMLRLDPGQSLAVTQGRQIVLEDLPMTGKCALQADDGRLLALVERDDQGRIRILRGFNLPPARPAAE